MTRNEVAAWLQMLLAEGVGNDAARRLLAAFGLPQQVLARVRVQVRELAWSQVWLEAWWAGWVIWARKTDEIAPGRFDGLTYSAYAWLRREVLMNLSSFFEPRI